MNLASFYSAIVVFEFDLYAMSCFYSIICHVEGECHLTDVFDLWENDAESRRRNPMHQLHDYRLMLR